MRLLCLIIAQAGTFSGSEPAASAQEWRIVSVDRVTINLVADEDEYTGQEVRQCYVSFWNRNRYIAATGAAFPLWENRGWRVWTPECGPFRAGGEHVNWACVLDGEGLIIEADEFVTWISDYDVERTWPAGLWANPIK